MRSYWNASIVQKLGTIVALAENCGIDEVLDAAYELNEELSDTAVDYIMDTKTYLENSYDTLWDASSFYTGNFRGSIKIVGSFSSDPLSTFVDFDEAWFLTPKELPSLKERVVHASWSTKKGDKSKTYTYPAGQIVQITGEDYRERVPPTPFVMEYLDELDEAERIKAGVD